MRKLLVFAMMLALVGTAMAADLGNVAPAKPDVTYPENIPNPVRQGGDTILNAFVVSIPASTTGTTVGYFNDYDEICPYSGSTSADVVYTLTPAADVAVDIDLLGSTYDTKLYVYDQNLLLVACNDDFYSDYVSKLENVALMGGVQYFVIIDGYGGANGNYVMNIAGFEPCVLTCPAGAELEGEPALVDGYADAHNGGCNSPEFGNPFGAITCPVFCGVSGWYIGASGGDTRDTDWFEVVVPADGFVEFIGDAEQPTYMFELGPQDCGSVGVIQNVIMGPCTEATMVIPGAPGSTVWFWVGPTTYTGPVNEFNYVLYTNLTCGGIAVESHSWTGVKSMFD
jgi:hypothetical protein